MFFLQNINNERTQQVTRRRETAIPVVNRTQGIATTDDSDFSAAALPRMSCRLKKFQQSAAAAQCGWKRHRPL